MFRGALEHLLFEQSYTARMLGPKIAALENDIKAKAGKAPKWALELEPDLLKLMNELCNASIHPNDGDVTKQSEFDIALMSALHQTFSYLLYVVYEAPFETKARLDAFRAKVHIFKK